jgi:hypothetical protein
MLLACFVLGAFMATIVSNVFGRWSLPGTLLLEGLLLEARTPRSGPSADTALAAHS